MTEIMPVPRNLHITVLRALPFGAAVLLPAACFASVAVLLRIDADRLQTAGHHQTAQ